MHLSPSSSCNCSPQKDHFKGTSLTPRLMWLFSSKNPFKSASLTPRLMRLFSSKKSFLGCASHPQAHAVFFLKKILSRVRLSPLGSCGCSPKKKKIPFKGVSLTCFYPTSCFPFHLPVLKMEAVVVKSSFPLLDHPQSFLCHLSDLSTCWKWKNQ